MNDSDEIVPPEQLRTMQIIAGALPLGLISFLAITLYIVLIQNGGQGQQPVPELPMFSLVAAVMLVGNIPLSSILPSIITRTALRQIAAGTWKVPDGAKPEQFATVTAKLLLVRQTTMIIGMALLEGAGFMACAAYLIERQVPLLGAVGVVVVLLLVRFPTKGKVSDWLERQAAALLDLQRAKDSEIR